MATQKNGGEKQSGARFYHTDDFAFREAVPQMHGDRRVAVHLKIMEWTPKCMVSYTHYDPGLVLARHGHKSDSFIYIIDGEVEVGGRPCPPGTLIVLDKEVLFGPLIAGPKGCTFLEVYTGDVTSIHENNGDYERLLAERGIRNLPRVTFDPPSA